MIILIKRNIDNAHHLTSGIIEMRRSKFNVGPSYENGGLFVSLSERIAQCKQENKKIIMCAR